MSESSRSKFRNENYVHSYPISMMDLNYNDDGFSYSSSARRLPVPSKSPLNIELNDTSCSTSLSRSTSQNTNYLHSASSSRRDTSSNSNGVLSTSSSWLPVSLSPPPKHIVECFFLFHKFVT